MVLLENCFYIATFDDDKTYSSKDVLIKDNRIYKIGSGLRSLVNEKTDRIIDCKDCVVIPGLVNTHHHFYQTLTRNLPAVQNAKLFDWLIYLYDIW